METQSVTFHRFPDLPAELRQSIWFYCLPHRVAQQDDPLLIDTIRKQQRCWSRRASRQNASPPLIASVCNESRQVALRWVKILPQDYFLNLGPIWVQPCLDVLHINWTQEYSGYADVWYNPMTMFFVEAIDVLGKIPISLVADQFHPFHLEPLPGDAANYDYPCLYIQDKFAKDIQEYPMYGGKPYFAISATLVFICLHATKVQALDSGLFGILGDAPLQTVDFDDEERLRAFHALFEKGCSNHKRPEVAKMFGSILAPSFQPRVQTWREKVDWLMMAYAWLAATLSDYNCIPIDGDPRLAWNPPLSADKTWEDGARRAGGSKSVQ